MTRVGMEQGRRGLAMLGLALIAVPSPALADVVDLPAVKDNTLYEDVAGSRSNGSGAHLFAGRTRNGSIQRAVLVFDVARAIPPGSIVEGAALNLHMSKTRAGPQPAELRRVLAEWGEGASNAPGNEGAGAPSQPDDATWIHRFFDDRFWIVPGGNFLAAPSAVISVGGVSAYTWGPTDQMVADVQAWLEDPSINHGWVLIGNELASGTAKRYDSREYPIPARRPVLTVEYSPPNQPPVADAGMDVQAECVSSVGATVRLDSTRSTDPDSTPGTNDDIVLFEWLEAGTVLGVGETLDIELSLGEHSITLRVTDSAGETDPDAIVASIVDTTPPELAVSLFPSVLWPPDHRMEGIDADVEVADSCDADPIVTLISIVSNEPDNGTGDGNTVDDIQDAAVGTTDFEFLLRAERSGRGGGRTYTVIYRAEDSSGNTMTSETSATAPRRRVGRSAPNPDPSKTDHPQ